MNGEVKLRCENVWKVYGPTPGDYLNVHTKTADTPVTIDRLRNSGHVVAAANVSFEVRHGEIFVIMGLSGSGKSTMLRCLSRLVEPTCGKISLDGEDILGMNEAELINLRRHKVGMVFQNFGLLPHLTALENIMLPLKLQGRPVRYQLDSAHRVIELVGLKGRETSFPYQLSGGQQQRVGIARSLAVDPEFWFLDEPFSALDPLIRREMQNEFLRLQRSLKKSIVFVTHDFQEALRIADRMMIMKDGQIVQLGTPAELMLNPVNQYVRDFSADAPISAVMTAEMAADEVVSPGITYHAVAPDTKLAALMPILAQHPEGVQVYGSQRLVTSHGVVSAMASH